MFFNLPFMDDSSEDDVPDFLKGDTSSAFDDLFASANVPETFDDIPDFLKGDDNAFLEALGAPAGASDDTISKLIAALTPATQDRDDPNFFESLLGGLLGGKKSSGINLGQLGLGLGLASLLKDRGAFDAIFLMSYMQKHQKAKNQCLLKRLVLRLKHRQQDLWGAVQCCKVVATCKVILTDKLISYLLTLTVYKKHD